MTKAPKKPPRSKPLSIRFTDPEMALLRKRAGVKPLGRFIRDKALQGDPERPKGKPHKWRTVRQPIKNSEPVAQLLSLLGQSRLSSNLNQIAKEANQGSLPVTKELEADLRAACDHVLEMRTLLLQALGVRILEEANPSVSLQQIFAGASGDQ